ncbi:M23 family metallopeptidase [Thermoleophilia bacterium SCSIO 60948]|nr:M23 family metallopeptidase [Thermoleophilia bacterium SCSIO 60948]
MAIPASASAIAVPGSDDVETVRGNDRVVVAERDEFEKAIRPPRPKGPFNPVVSDGIDYGDSGAVFGASRSGRSHEGQDMMVPTGTPIVAPTDMQVTEVGSDGGRGNYVNAYDPKLDQSYVFMHMVEPTSFAEGDEVKAGQQIGAVGCTGSCYGEHLHFEIHPGQDPYGEAIDPMPLLEDWKLLSKPLG